jgi:cell division protein ZapA
MAQMTVKINGYSYTVACEDGQEAHLQDMAHEVEARIESIKAMGSPSGEGRLLVLAALLMADELHDTAIELDSLRNQPAPSGTPTMVDPGQERQNRRIAKLARKAEDIAASLEQP